MVIRQRAIKITSPEIADLVMAICPDFNEMNYEKQLRGNYFMIGFPDQGDFAIVPSPGVMDHWDRIDNDISIQLLRFIR